MLVRDALLLLEAAVKDGKLSKKVKVTVNRDAIETLLHAYEVYTRKSPLTVAPKIG